MTQTEMNESTRELKSFSNESEALSNDNIFGNSNLDDSLPSPSVSRNNLFQRVNLNIYISQEDYFLDDDYFLDVLPPNLKLISKLKRESVAFFSYDSFLADDSLAAIFKNPSRDAQLLEICTHQLSTQLTKFQLPLLSHLI